MASNFDNCPKCESSFIGEPIPAKDVDFFGGKTHFRREIGIDGGMMGIYDGIVAYKCPDCGYLFPIDSSSGGKVLFNSYINLIKKAKMISKKELLMGRDKKYASEYTKEVSDNLDKLLIPLNILRKRYGKPMYVSSGWRPAAVNASLSNAAKKSNHMKGLAADFKDPDGKLRDWVVKHLEWLAGLGLYMEDFRWTPGWVHFQIVAPRSKNRVFVPSARPPRVPDAWEPVWDKGLNY